MRKKVWQTALFALLLSLPLIFMDFFTRSYVTGSHFSLWYVPALLFTLSWTVLVVGVTLSLKGSCGRVFYALALSPFLILFITHAIYFKMSSFYFSFSLMALAEEGSGYLLDTIAEADWWVWVLTFALVTLVVLILLRLPKPKKSHWKACGFVVLAAVVLFASAWLSLGKSYEQLTWSSFRNARHIYNDFSDVNKGMRVVGLYEYTFRNLHKVLEKTEIEENPEDIAFLDEVYSDAAAKSNAYTGIFNGKNVIFLQLEGIDDWILTPEIMPNLSALKNRSLDFTQHYSLFTGGGSTFNSEFAVNTGFITPLSFEENVYSYHKNLFDQTLPKLFGALGYQTNAFHMNNGEFYSRTLNYNSWGYDHYYGLRDLKSFDDQSYAMDQLLIQDPDFYELMFHQNQPFLDYIITYTPHFPFAPTGKACNYLLHQQYGDSIPDLDEEGCIGEMAAETDRMVGLLMDALKKEGLYDNTVIVAYADHYLYTISDKSILDKYKTTENNLINHTPFFIWSSDIEPQKFNKVTMQTNILPTILNLFGVDYNPNSYICTDALAPDYEGFAFFSDYSCFDGKQYMTENIPQEVLQIIRKNDLTLKTDYFRRRQQTD